MSIIAALVQALLVWMDEHWDDPPDPWADEMMDRCIEVRASCIRIDR